MQDTRQESIEKLNELIKEFGTAMLTTIDGGVLRSRPMATQEAEFDGTLFFLTGADTHKDEEIKKDSRVNVSYADTSDNTMFPFRERRRPITIRIKLTNSGIRSTKRGFPKVKPTRTSAS